MAGWQPWRPSSRGTGRTWHSDSARTSASVTDASIPSERDSVLGAKVSRRDFLHTAAAVARAATLPASLPGSLAGALGAATVPGSPAEPHGITTTVVTSRINQQLHELSIEPRLTPLDA